MNILPSTRLAIRATIGVALTELVTRMLGVPHSYWAVLTVLLLITQSWGESLQRAWKRFAMTIVGCVLAGLLIYVLHAYSLVIILLVFVAIFGVIYTATTSYNLCMFYAAALVVLSFYLAGVPAFSVVWQRILDTAIGVVVVGLVSGLVLPDFASQRFTENAHSIFKAVSKQFKLICYPIATTVTIKALTQAGHQYANDMQQLRNLLAQVQYESWVLFKQRHRALQLLKHLDLLIHYMSNATQTAIVLSHVDLSMLAMELTAYTRAIALEFDKLGVGQLQSAESGQVEFAYQALQTRCHEVRHAKTLTPDEFLALSAYIYYCRRAKDELTELSRLIREQKLWSTTTTTAA
jgi:uncharacterized membrane protein YccC